MSLYIDFLSKKMGHRQQQASFKKEYLARALGLKKNMIDKVKIIDATGGLANDAFILSVLGFSVTVLERSKILYDLIVEAIDRAHYNPITAPIVQRLEIIHADAIDFIPQLSEETRPDLIYIDPMFPKRKKSALVKKDMQQLQAILAGYDDDAERLLGVVLACAKKRVVVKRPRLAAPLMEPGRSLPDFSVKGSSSRFDVYLI